MALHHLAAHMRRALITSLSHLAGADFAVSRCALLEGSLARVSVQLLRLLMLHLDLLYVFARLIFVLHLGVLHLTASHDQILTVHICAVDLLAIFGRVTLVLLDVMILLTVEDVKVLLGFVVGSGATRAGHVCLVSDASANYVEVRLPLLLVSQLTVRLVPALEVILVAEAAAGAGRV